MRYLALVLATVILATGLVVLADSQEEPALAASVRGPDQILGVPRYGEKRV